VPASYTLPGGLLSTYDVGFWPSVSAIHHEDLTDVLTILDSSDTPAVTTFPKGRARDVVHSWPIDTLVAPASAGAPDGVDFAGDTLTTPARLFNGCQEFRRDVIVSDRERDANPAGIRDMYDHQVMKEFKVLRRNCEYTLFRNGATGSATGVETSAASAAPVMAGFRGQFGYAGTITTSGASGSLIFATGDLANLSQVMFTNGAEPDSVWMAPSTKRQFIDATLGSSINVRNIAATDQRLVANIDVFESPFNQLLAIITDRFIPMGTASASGYAWFMGDRSMSKLAFYRPPQHKQMGKGGDHTRGIVLMDLTLELAHPSAWGCVTAVTGSSSLVT
jgi:hypothetical protein